jgi:EAL domain-containing protein (putative c-di-GMP-specific phosphodiesterase class I)
MENAAASTSVLGKLRDVGVKIALDDFGTRYWSLSYLQRFPIDTLKADKSFVKEIADDIDSATLVRTIIAMAQSLRLKVVAEGVETDDQLEFLKLHNCDIVQGYLISRPLPAEDFERWLVGARPSIAERASG